MNLYSIPTGIRFKKTNTQTGGKKSQKKQIESNKHFYLSVISFSVCVYSNSIKVS